MQKILFSFGAFLACMVCTPHAKALTKEEQLFIKAAAYFVIMDKENAGITSCQTDITISLLTKHGYIRTTVTPGTAGYMDATDLIRDVCEGVLKDYINIKRKLGDFRP